LAKGPNLAAFDPVGEQIVRLFNPRREKWGAHFVRDDARIVGRTPIGRACVALLKMNDPERVRVRILFPVSGTMNGPSWKTAQRDGARRHFGAWCKGEIYDSVKYGKKLTAAEANPRQYRHCESVLSKPGLV
jgi:hypothetical protein